MRLLLLCISIAGCGHVGTKADAAASIDAPKDGKQSDAPPGTYSLTVKNYQSWCSVTVNGGTASAGVQQIVNVLPGVIPLSATAQAGFEIYMHMWHHTDADTAGT